MVRRARARCDNPCASGNDIVSKTRNGNVVLYNVFFYIQSDHRSYYQQAHPIETDSFHAVRDDFWQPSQESCISNAAAMT